MNARLTIGTEPPRWSLLPESANPAGSAPVRRKAQAFIFYSSIDLFITLFNRYSHIPNQRTGAKRTAMTIVDTCISGIRKVPILSHVRRVVSSHLPSESLRDAMRKPSAVLAANTGVTRHEMKPCVIKPPGLPIKRKNPAKCTTSSNDQNARINLLSSRFRAKTNAYAAIGPETVGYDRAIMYKNIVAAI
jgi:hypothetical protein